MEMELNCVKQVHIWLKIYIRLRQLVCIRVLLDNCKFSALFKRSVQQSVWLIQLKLNVNVVYSRETALFLRILAFSI